MLAADLEAEVEDYSSETEPVPTARLGVRNGRTGTLWWPAPGRSKLPLHG